MSSKTRSAAPSVAAPVEYKSLMDRIKWVNLFALTVTPLVGLYGASATPLMGKTLLWSVFLYAFAMLVMYFPGTVM